MPKTKAAPIDHTGAGTLRVQGQSENVHYRVQGDPAALRRGHATLRGAITATVAFAYDAFRSGDGVLTAETGVLYRLRMLGHTAGSDVVFVEFRI